MNADQRLLAIEGVETLDAYLGEHYRDLSRDLNASLAGAAMETSPEEAIANKSLIDKIVQLLPAQGDKGFSVSKPHEVRLLQASTLWQETFPSGAYELRPFYVVGAETSGRKANLLLHAPSNDKVEDIDKPTFNPEYMVVAQGIPKRQYNRASTKMDAMPSTPLGEEELSRLFKDGSYVVRAYSANSNIITDRFKAPLGRAVIRASRFKYITALSDHTLGRYRVFDHIAQLAVLFGKKAEVQAILANTSEVSDSADTSEA